MSKIIRREWDYLLNQFGYPKLGFYYMDYKDAVFDSYGAIVGGKSYAIKQCEVRGIMITDPLTIKAIEGTDVQFNFLDQMCVFKVSATDLHTGGVMDNDDNYTYADDPLTTVVEGILNKKYIRFKGEWYQIEGVKKGLIYQGETSAVYFTTSKNVDYTQMYGESELVIVEPSGQYYTVFIDGVVSGAYLPNTLVTLTTPEKEGYVFTGWQSEQVTVDNNQFVMPESDVYLTTQWERIPAETYTVHVDGQLLGAYAPGVTVTLTVPTRPHYTFNGWTSQQVTVTDNQFVMPESNVIVTSEWIAIPQHNVSVDGAVTPYYVGDTVAVSAGTREGYVFNGWTAVGVVLDNPLNSNITFTMPDNDVTLTTNWIEVPVTAHTVTVVNTGSGTSGQFSVEHGHPLTLTAGTKDRYNFTRWNVTPSDAVIFETADTEPSVTAYIEADCTIEAVWVFNGRYLVTFVGIERQPEYYLPNATVTLNAGTAPEHKVFNGWTCDNPNVTFTSQSVYSSFTMPSADITVTANWKWVQYTVTFRLNGAVYATDTVDWNTTVTRPSDPVEQYKDFGGWYTDATFVLLYDFTTPVTADLTLYGQMIQQTATVTFDADGGTAVQSIAVDKGSAIGTLPVTSKQGYSFDGWMLNGTVIDSTYIVTADITLVAKWTESASTEESDIDTSNSFILKFQTGQTSFTKTAATTAWNADTSYGGNSFNVVTAYPSKTFGCDYQNVPSDYYFTPDKGEFAYLNENGYFNGTNAMIKGTRRLILYVRHAPGVWGQQGRQNTFMLPFHEIDRSNTSGSASYGVFSGDISALLSNPPSDLLICVECTALQQGWYRYVFATVESQSNLLSNSFYITSTMTQFRDFDANP